MSKEFIETVVNGVSVVREVESRLLLSDFLRHELRLTGTHVGCEHGVCGACTVQVDGRPVRSCIMFAVQVDGRRVRTIEDLAWSEQDLHPLQQAFRAEHGMQCGFCTPGFLMSIEPHLTETAAMTDDEVRALLSGNICRCTGYETIVRAVRRAERPLTRHVGIQP